MSSLGLQVAHTRSAVFFLQKDFVRSALEANQVNSNAILPILQKCARREVESQSPPADHLWIVVYYVHRNGAHDVLFIASCTDGYLGKYPIFLFTPYPYASLFGDHHVPALRALVQKMYEKIDPSRVYSIFGPEVITRQVAAMWRQRTGIRELPEPYYHAKISYLTAQTLVQTNIPSRPHELTELRPAVEADLPAVAQLGEMFAAESPPFTLSPHQAYREAEILVKKHQVWVYTVSSHPQIPPRVASIVAFTRNTDVMATITKVYTHPDFRGQRRAEQLVREVCRHLIYTLHKTWVALFVGIENKAANVYGRVGFLGVGRHAQPVQGIDPWIEIGFDPEYVTLGHW